MSMTAMGLLASTGGEGYAAVAARFLAFARRFSEKELARAGGASIRTARAWRSDPAALPQGPHLARLAAVFGAEFLLDVFAPVLTDADISLSLRAARLERDFVFLREEIDRVEALASGMGAVASAGACAPRRKEQPRRRLLGGSGAGLGLAICLAFAAVTVDAARVVSSLPDTVSGSVAADDPLRRPRGVRITTARVRLVRTREV